MEYRNYTVAFKTSKGEEYRVHVYADSEEQALRIASRKFSQFSDADFKVVG